MDTKPSTNGDALTERLRARMVVERSRYYRSLVVLVTLFFLVAAGVIWWFYPRGANPDLVIVALDGIALPGQEAPVRAQVEALEGEAEPRFLGRLPVTFQEARSLASAEDRLQTVKADTQSSGQAQASMRVPVEAAELKFLARLLSVRRGIVSEGPACITIVPADTPLVVVEVSHLLADPAVDVWAGNLANIQHHTDAAETLQALKRLGYQVVYLALDSERAFVYRQQRRWLESRQAVLPMGPLLGRPTYHQDESESAARQQVAMRLAAQYQVAAVAHDRSAAAIYRDLKVRTIMLGNADAPEGVKRATSWKAIPELIGKD